jgi:hypothetical protein
MVPRVASEDWAREGQAPEEQIADVPPAWVTGASAGSMRNILSRRGTEMRLGSAQLGPDATMRSLSRSNSASSVSTCSNLVAAGTAAQAPHGSAAQAPDGNAAQAPRPAGNASGLATTRLSNLGASVKRQQQFDRSARAYQERLRQRQVAAEVTLGLEKDQTSALGLALAREKERAAYVSEELAAQRLWLLKEQARIIDFTAPDKQVMLFRDRSGVSYVNVIAEDPQQIATPTTQHGRDAGEDDGVSAGKSAFAEKASSDLVATSANLSGAESGGNRPLSPLCGIPGTKDEDRLALAHEHVELVDDSADAGTTVDGRSLLNYFASEATGEYAVSVETEEDKRLSRLGLLEPKRQERRRAVRETIATYNSIRKAPGYVPIEALLNPNEGLLSTASRFCRSLTHTHLTTFGGSKIWTPQLPKSTPRTGH